VRQVAIVPGLLVDPSQAFPNGSGRPMNILDGREAVKELL
jgi:hypothetical protein